MYFVTGIGTDVGKTLVSAILTECLEADYWKPIQAGDLDYSDTDRVRELLSNGKSVCHRESYRLNHSLSPHAAAKLDGIRINLEEVRPPSTERPLIVEGAGGLMVPLNERSLVADLIGQMGASVILVSKNYLGSINHSLLTLDVLKSRGISVRALVFNGQPAPASEEVIIEYSGCSCILRVGWQSKLDVSVVRRYAAEWRNSFQSEDLQGGDNVTAAKR